MSRRQTGEDGVDTRALQAYLGHRNFQNTTRHTALAPDRVKGFWRDHLANGVCFDRKPKTIIGGEQSAAVVRASQSRE
jgi:hypothetical protein